MTASEEIIKIADRIESTLQENPIAQPNPQIPKRLKFLAAQLSDKDGYCAKTAYRIASRAELYYSARKHTTSKHSAADLWSEMTFDLLNRIRSRADFLEREQP